MYASVFQASLAFKQAEKEKSEATTKTLDDGKAALLHNNIVEQCVADSVLFF